MKERILSILKSEKAQTLTLFALLTPVLALALGLVIDVGILYSQQRQAQNAADAAALAAARVLLEQGTSTAINAGQSYSSQNGFTAAIHIPPTSGPHVTDTHYVEAEVDRTVTPTFLRAVWNGNFHVHARAVAGYKYSNGGGGVMTLNLTWPSFTLNGNIYFNVLDDGIVHVNSSSSSAMTLNGNVTFDYTNKPTIVGDYDCNGSVSANDQECNWQGPHDLFVTGAPVQSDPLAHISQPTYTNCDHTYYSINGQGTYYLQPGVYCGGISINGNINAIFQPGTYILAGGGLNVNGNYDVQGAGVTFFITSWNGIPGTFSMNGTGYAHFTPPTTGALKDIVIFEDRANAYPITINGDGNLNGLEGIIYAAAGSLIINGNAQMHASFVVNKLIMNGNAHIDVYSYFSNQIQGQPEVFLAE